MKKYNEQTDKKAPAITKSKKNGSSQLLSETVQDIFMSNLGIPQRRYYLPFCMVLVQI
jgi:hypothetical protein